MRCGIDLGTTNSCIVVVEERDHRVIGDGQGNETFPSVVHVSRDGTVTVGHAAKNRMGEAAGPIATIKRKMGSTETVILGGRKHTPVEVSTMILRHLKDTAERACGRTIDRAVVTVPAYFNHSQRQHTDDAVRHAGFKEVVTLLEPVAAALAYSLGSDRPSLRVFVFDLGGGTFDATVLEKDMHGGLNVLSFGGDPHLGGDDVDARLAQLILARLQRRGFRLDLDLNRPEDYSRFQRLKFYAEIAKKALSRQPAAEIVRQGLFEDREGVTVDLEETITRQDLEGCCRDLIERSVHASLATLQKEHAAIAIDSIDEIIMVGGMSFMPLVQTMVAEAFGRTPKLVDPDLIVAKGAAAKAAEMFPDREETVSGLALELRFDRCTDQSRTRISGVFDRPLRGYSVFLTRGRDEKFETIDGKDRFAFDVALVPGTENVFGLSVEDECESRVIEREIRIVHNPSVAPVLASPGSVVTKPIKVWTVGGPHILFQENTALPHTTSDHFETADQSGRIIAPILEGDQEVARLEIHDIPQSQRIGTTVTITITIRADYRIEASAKVHELDREVKIDFEIKPVDVSGITSDYVRQQLRDLDGRADQAVRDCPSPDSVKVFRLQFALAKDLIESELGEAEPKRAKLKEKLTEMASLIQRLPARERGIDLKPTLEQFGTRLSEVLSFAVEHGHSRLGEVEPRLDELRRQAREAWENRDAIAWRRVNRQIDDIQGMLAPELSPMDKALAWSAGILMQIVPELEQAARGRYSVEIAGIKERAAKVFYMVQNHLADPNQGVAEIARLYQEQVLPLQGKLGLTAREAPVAASPAAVGEGYLTKR
jgi:molecular chaperone DnaK (HSP70)